MKTDFWVLWVDDNSDFVETLQLMLQISLDDKGFALQSVLHESANEEAQTAIYTDLNSRDIELLVVDYRLGEVQGDKLIQSIRERHYYQDIVFYSQGGIPKEIQRLDGVFFVDKNDAKERIKDIVELKMKRSSDLTTVRGWIVADAIELEIMLSEVVSRCLPQ